MLVRRLVMAAAVALVCAAVGAPALGADASEPGSTVTPGPSGYASSFAASRPVQWRPAEGTERLGVDGGSGYGQPGPLVVAADPPWVPGTFSPRSWAGDRSAALGGVIGLQMRLDSGNATPEVRLQLKSGGGTVLHAVTPNPDPDGSMEYYRGFQVPLTADSWTTAGGAPATDGDLAAVLTDFAALEVDVPVTDTTGTPEFYLNGIYLAGPANVGLSRIRVIERQNHRIRGYLPQSDPCAGGREVSLVRLAGDGSQQLIDAKTVGELDRFGFPARDLDPGRYAFRLGEDTVDGVTCTAAISHGITIG